MIEDFDLGDIDKLFDMPIKDVLDCKEDTVEDAVDEQNSTTVQNKFKIEYFSLILKHLQL